MLYLDSGGIGTGLKAFLSFKKGYTYTTVTNHQCDHHTAAQRLLTLEACHLSMTSKYLVGVANKLGIQPLPRSYHLVTGYIHIGSGPLPVVCPNKTNVVSTSHWSLTDSCLLNQRFHRVLTPN
jgi:hypothetical protein